MQVREIKEGYKFADKLFAKYPLLGNAILKESTQDKINEQAKKVQLQNKKMAKETEELKQQEKKMRSRGVSKGVKKVQPKVREISEPTSKSPNL